MENQIDSGLVRTNSELNSVVTKWQKTEKNWNKGPGYIFYKMTTKFLEKTLILRFITYAVILVSIKIKFVIFDKK